MSAPYQYVILHRSCANLFGIGVCQAIHAATECIRTVPVSDQTHVVALVAEKSEDLVLLAERLREAGIHHVLIREPDPPYNGAATAVGIEPQDRERIRPFVAHFKVFR